MWRARRRQRWVERRAAEDLAATRRRLRDLERLAHDPILDDLRRTSGWDAVDVRATSLPDGCVALELRYGDEHGIGNPVLDQTGGGGLAPWPTGVDLPAEVRAACPLHVVVLTGWLLVWDEDRSAEEAVAEAKRLASSASAD